MAMTQIGYSLLDENNVEVAHWGDIIGQIMSIPNPLILPNGDHVCAPSVGQVGAWRIVPRFGQYGSTTASSFDGTNYNITMIQPIPQSVSQYQARMALNAAGLLTSAQTAVDASTDPTVSIAWQFSQTIDRTSPFIASIGAKLNLTPAQIDALFIQAATYS